MPYHHHPSHRNGALNKSQWRIARPEELTCFQRSVREGWSVSPVGWGLHITNEELAILGVAQDHSTEVFLAKFVDPSEADSWHGYPADHQRNLQDIPDPHVLRAWMSDGLITPAKARKIARAQPCHL